jgi:hypothetical protein
MLPIEIQSAAVASIVEGAVLDNYVECPVCTTPEFPSGSIPISIDGLGNTVLESAIYDLSSHSRPDCP